MSLVRFGLELSLVFGCGLNSFVCVVVVILDLFSDDFDSKFSLKVKSAGPQSTVRIFCQDKFYC